MLDRRSAKLNQAILQVIAASPRPIGQGAINFALRRRGLSVSIPTVGRRLQELQFEGLVERHGVEGRVLTSRGLALLGQLNADARLQSSGDALLNLLRRGDRAHLLEFLSARRVIEGEIAALAAVHASASAIRKMDELLAKHAASINRGELGLAEDVSFHHEIARASQNRVLFSLVRLLRDHQRYNLLTAAMRTAVGSRRIVDHQAILTAIRAHDPWAARQAMVDHLQRVADDMNRYWDRWVSNRPGLTREARRAAQKADRPAAVRPSVTPRGRASGAVRGL
ncbi:MAG TPA: FCD domain-containing protein [bacterium]|nr:FCD domain-containing protein [bacterium]